MQPFPGSPPALFQPMPSGVWPQQMFANFGSPAAGPLQGMPQHQPPPPPPPPQQQQKQQKPQQRSQPATECKPEPRVQTPTSPLSPAPSYKRISRSDGACCWRKLCYANLSEYSQYIETCSCNSSMAASGCASASIRTPSCHNHLHGGMAGVRPPGMNSRWS